MKRFLKNISPAECLTSVLVILAYYTDSAGGVMVTFQGKNYDCVCGCKLVAPSEDGDGWVTKVVPPDSRCDSSNRANQIDIHSVTCPCSCTLTIDKLTCFINKNPMACSLSAASQINDKTVCCPCGCSEDSDSIKYVIPKVEDLCKSKVKQCTYP